MLVRNDIRCLLHDRCTVRSTKMHTCTSAVSQGRARRTRLAPRNAGRLRPLCLWQWAFPSTLSSQRKDTFKRHLVYYRCSVRPSPEIMRCRADLTFHHGHQYRLLLFHGLRIHLVDPLHREVSASRSEKSIWHDVALQSLHSSVRRKVQRSTNQSRHDQMQGRWKEDLFDGRNAVMSKKSKLEQEFRAAWAALTTHCVLVLHSLSVTQRCVLYTDQ